MGDLVNSFLEPNDKSIYNSPSTLDIENHNLIEFRPVSGLSWGANETIEVRINSSNELIDFGRSYLKFDVTATGTNPVISAMGYGACINTVSEMVSGYQMPIQSGINLIHSLENKLCTGERKSFIDVTESANISGTTGNTALTQAILPIPGVLSSSARRFPLPLINGGITYNFLLESNANVFRSGSDQSYTITNFAMVLCLVSPSTSYLTQLATDYRNGGQVKIPVELKKVYNTPCVELDTFTVPIQTGFLRSVNSLTVLHRLAANVNHSNADAFNAASALLASSKELEYWNTTIDAIVRPRNKQIPYYSALKSSRPEHLAQFLTGWDSEYSALTAPSTSNDFIYQSYKANSSWNSGISTKTGLIELNMKYRAAPSASDLITAIIAYDAMIIIENGNVDCIYN